jgi:trans-aconitate 2-methyltransferase
MTSWDPRQYDRFQQERSQPFFDLMTLVEPQPRMRLVDLGCGTGKLTTLLHDHLEAASTLGIDNSPEMLAEAVRLKREGVRFELTEVAAFSGGPFDLIFSNAAIHWLPDHPALLKHLAGLLAPEGQMAVQVPANHDHPSHLVAAEVAGESPFREALHGYVRRSPVLSPEAYSRLLDQLGFRRQHVRLQVYSHHLPSRDDVVEWVKGTLLTDYRERIGDTLFPQFLERYKERLLPQLENTRPYHYPFKRILFWGRR